MYEEFRAAARAVAVTDRSACGLLRVTGRDSGDLLNRLSTNAVDGLVPGSGAATVLTTNKGRVVDVLGVTALHDRHILVTSPGQQRRVAEWIEGFTFREDCSVSDITPGTAAIGVVGPKAARLVRALSGTPVAGLRRWHNREARVAETDVIVVRTDADGLRQYDLLVPRSRARLVWGRVVRRAIRYGGGPIGEEAREMVRVLHGVGRLGREYGEQYNPLEAGLRGAVSFNKGCYVGQEVVARLDTYRKVQRHLVRLSVQSDSSVPGPASAVWADGARVGYVTSVAAPPAAEGPAALAYVRKGYAAPGTRLEVSAGAERCSATVLRL